MKRCMSTPRMCEEHGKPSVTRCSWCAKPICETCILEADKHKLCARCASKLAKDTPVLPRLRRTAEGPIRNIDETLTQEQLKAARERYVKQHEEEQERWPKLSE
ncbi:hypothetical protein GF367_00875 [Candidatus Woesearchaeota archaeon]|nr:hypothetical protein [Candidatus Woesearchaeota archaeon]